MDSGQGIKPISLIKTGRSKTTQTAWTKKSKNDTNQRKPPHPNILIQTDFKSFPGRTLRKDAVLITEGLLFQRMGAATSSVPLLERS